MDAIVSFFQGIGNFITSIVDFIVGIFSDIVYLIQLTGKFLGQLPGYFSWMPAEISALLLVLFAIVVLYKILGREG